MGIKKSPATEAWATLVGPRSELMQEAKAKMEAEIMALAAPTGSGFFHRREAAPWRWEEERDFALAFPPFNSAASFQRHGSGIDGRQSQNRPGKSGMLQGNGKETSCVRSKLECVRCNRIGGHSWELTWISPHYSL
jgi:hypothetical protein